MPRLRPSRITRWPLCCSCLLLLFAICLAACGGSNHPSTSSGSSGKPPAKALTADAYKNAACMRSHGVPSFPDPQISSQGVNQTLSIHLTPGIAGSPAFKSAFKACEYLLPGGGGNLQAGPSPAQVRTQVAGTIAFARCMRDHGFPRFPDPNSQGQLTLTMLQRAGIDLSEPAVKPAADSCTSASNGVITKADVAEAIANPNSLGGHSQAVAQTAP
jgi:hypothetical protein